VSFAPYLLGTVLGALPSIFLCVYSGKLAHSVLAHGSDTSVTTATFSLHAMGVCTAIFVAVSIARAVDKAIEEEISDSEDESE